MQTIARVAPNVHQCAPCAPVRERHTHIDHARARKHDERNLFIYLFSYTYRRVRVRVRERVCLPQTPWCVVHMVHIGATRGSRVGPNGTSTGGKS
jgi:hypothetical protein